MMERRRILCVDDEPKLLSALGRILADEYDVDLASSAKEALLAFSRPWVEYDVVVSDMRMSEMSGAALLARVSQTHPLTVRILLTGDLDARVGDAAAKAVATGQLFCVLAKPCPSPKLRSTIADAVKLHRELRGLRDPRDPQSKNRASAQK